MARAAWPSQTPSRPGLGVGEVEAVAVDLRPLEFQDLAHSAAGEQEQPDDVGLLPAGGPLVDQPIEDIARRLAQPDRARASLAIGQIELPLPGGAPLEGEDLRLAAPSEQQQAHGGHVQGAAGLVPAQRCGEAVILLGGQEALGSPLPIASDGGAGVAVLRPASLERGLLHDDREDRRRAVRGGGRRATRRASTGPCGPRLGLGDHRCVAYDLPDPFAPVLAVNEVALCAGGHDPDAVPLELGVPDIAHLAAGRRASTRRWVRRMGGMIARLRSVAAGYGTGLNSAPGGNRNGRPSQSNQLLRTAGACFRVETESY